MKRREFLHKTTALAAAGISAPSIIPSHVLAGPGRPGANDRLQIAFIGLGGRARWLLQYEDFSAVQIVAIADPFLRRCDEFAKVLPDGEKWKKYQNYHEMFEKEKLDAVFVETTTHARVLVCIHVMQAGLDVYAEKPLTLTVAEGRTLAQAARKYNRVLQTGTQQRSIPINVYASKLVREGAIGKVKSVVVCNFEGPEIWKPKPAEPMPEGLDWDQWCNQTELRPYHRDLHLRWAWWWDYDGGGKSWGVSGWGTHSLDQVQCALGTDDTGPVEIVPEEPGPQCKVTLRYSNGTLVKLEQEKINDHQQLGGIFVGEKGVLQIIRGNFKAEPKELDAELRKNAPEPTPEGKNECAPHLKDFFECMRTRKQPLADVEIGHRSTTVCHLVNICREVGRKLQWDPKEEKFIGDEEANKKLSRPRRKGYELPKIV
ncbi:Gfo/Idh/MocA family oxidoreductase [Candidatus Sumerlaeota bacterium]|nr:Gfo/Idh/MocA family oxidoreductase [Candidatus Sumerlaeota bacterium]